MGILVIERCVCIYSFSTGTDHPGDRDGAGGRMRQSPFGGFTFKCCIFLKKQTKPNLRISIRRIFIFPTLSRHALPRAGSFPPHLFPPPRIQTRLPRSGRRVQRGVFLYSSSSTTTRKPPTKHSPPTPREPGFCIDRIESADFKQGPVGQGGERGAGHSPTAHMGPGENTPSFTATGSLHWSLWSSR